MLNIKSYDKVQPNLVDICVDRLLGKKTVIVETHRLRHLIETQYNLVMRDQGKKAWPSAEVYVWDTWLGRTWSKLQEQKDDVLNPLLTANQSMQLWEQTIRDAVREQSDVEYILWHITATASRARSAYQLMCLYRIDAGDFDHRASPDALEFLRWLDRYQKKLHAGKWLDYEQLPDRIRQSADEFAAMSDSALFIAEFDTWPPQYQEMLDALTSAGVNIETTHQSLPSETAEPHRREFETTDEEIKTCALWAKSVIEKNPSTHKVGIAVPRLRRILNRVNRIFAAHLNPDSVMEKRETRNMSFHVTLGTELAQIPIVVDALNMIELIRGDVDVSVMIEVIRSDRIRGWSEESAARSFLTASILTIGTSRVSIDDVLKVISRNQRLECPRLVSILRKASKSLSSIPDRQSYADWGQFFMDWMKNFQSESRGNRKFGAEEAQAHQAFCNVVESLAELDLISPQVGVDAAISKLTRLVSQVSTQPRALQTPIQIGEMITMSGQSYTHLWIMGMNNSDLPGTANPNPFIPIELQKSRSIPNCSPQLLMERMNQRFERLLNASQSAVMSYSLSDADETLQPHTEMRNCETFVMPQKTGAQTYKDVIREHFSECKSFTDWQAPPVSDEELKTFSGGSRALQNQSKCQFRAFANSRLKAEQTQTLELGITAKDHGSFVHELLHQLYSDYSLPCARSENNELNHEIVSQIAGEILQDANAKRIRPIRKQLLEAEQQELVDLIMGWLSIDIRHNDFVKVFALEEKISIKIKELPVTMIVDRVDEHMTISNSGPLGPEHNYLSVIDYKTGASYRISHIAGNRPGEGNRPKELQLLLYAYALEKLNDYKVRYAAYGILTKSSPSSGGSKMDSGEISELNYYWRDVVELLAESFMDGEADVDPMQYGCQYCHLSPLCRIDPKMMRT